MLRIIGATVARIATLALVVTSISAGAADAGTLGLTAKTAYGFGGYQYVNLGGVNLNAYCQKTFGGAFRSVLIGNTAGDWTCEQSAGNRRPISVKDACAMQYGKSGLKAEATNWSDPLSWRCFELQRRPTPPVYKGVNLTYYCQKTFGSPFKAVLIGSTAGDWTCEQSAGNRRPISVKNACVLEYGNTVKEAKALNWSDPLSWRCVF